MKDGVRVGIVDSLRRDVERRGGRTAGRLAIAGVVGVVGAMGLTLALSGHSHAHPLPWHVMIISTLWAGLLVVSLAIVLLGIRTPELPLGRAVGAGVLGLALAGLCGALCPDRNLLAWWGGTPIGRAVGDSLGDAFAVVCFGWITTFFLGLASTSLTLSSRERGGFARLTSALALVVLLLPAVVLQSFEFPPPVFWCWLVGTAVGAYCGVAAAVGVRRLMD